ncbi:Wzz/FepE/Etk N-terminal domain-containing protein [Rheinheimera sp.]|uniref:Wzz/FepE/Etk N-terminal domain-containing protein n=1 Tax=Rheinheimera sp. TaxID=1869214 RepID=UPI0040489C16
MSESINPSQAKVADDEIDLRELFAAIWQGKWLIIAVTAVFAVASVIYALSLPNIYKSEALLAPVSEDAGMKIPGQLGGLAALAGVNLGGGGGEKTTLAIEVLKSRDFIGRFIDKHDLLVPLMAAEGWSRVDNSLILDAEIFQLESKQWVRKSKLPVAVKPSLLEAHERFIQLLDVFQDAASGMITLSVKHYSPFLAQQWATLLVKDINAEMRSRELSEAQNSINYLTEQIEKTNIVDVRTMLFSLIEEQTKIVMLANVREEYVFKTIDGAIVPEEKHSPKRSLIILLITFGGGFFATVFVILSNAFFRKS